MMAKRKRKVGAERPTKLQRWLKANDACPAARRWVGRKTLATAWRTCRQLEWMWWALIITSTRFRRAECLEGYLNCGCRLRGLDTIRAHFTPTWRGSTIRCVRRPSRGRKTA